MRWKSTLLERKLAGVGGVPLNLFAVSAAFAVYFCMYAFRKPFAAGVYEGMHVGFAGFEWELKTALVVSQILGYALSKFIGVKFCSEATRGRRATALIALVVAAEAALLAFAAVPTAWKPAALFFNGLPLGMVWGLVVQFLEGRRTSDFLLAGLSCSFILASGVVKDVGRALMTPVANDAFLAAWRPIPEFWMPVATGALFLPPFLLAVWLLDHLPNPSVADVAERMERRPMGRDERWAFVKTYAVGFAGLMTAYLFITAFRDVRDNYTVDVLEQLGYSYAIHGASISRMEICVALGVLGAMACLSMVRDNRKGLIAVFAVMLAGTAVMAAATWLWQRDVVDGFWWLALLGVGSYLVYVPYNSLLFDRLLASTQTAGTAVFAIYVADAVGYSGTVLLMAGKDVAWSEASRTGFLTDLAYGCALATAVGVLVGGSVFLRKAEPFPLAVAET
ncbi:MAG: hypothetical protein KDA61_04980 [Planctomycetales bacterium]|nr:hypothetical protein [Planctomycetales bacterium]